jgi:hypothetical protein
MDSEKNDKTTVANDLVEFSFQLFDFTEKVNETLNTIWIPYQRIVYDKTIFEFLGSFWA